MHTIYWADNEVVIFLCGKKLKSFLGSMMNEGDAYMQFHPLLRGYLRRDFWQENPNKMALTHGSPLPIFFIPASSFGAPDLHGGAI